MTVAAIMALARRVEQLEAQVGALLARRAAETPDPDAELAAAMSNATLGRHGPDWFLAGEVWRLAQAEAAEAAATGDAEPHLAGSLRLAGVSSAHGLGRWLAAREGRDFIRSSAERGGVPWRAVSPD